MPKGYKNIGDDLYVSKQGKVWSERSKRHIGMGARATVNWYGYTIQVAHLVAGLFVPHTEEQNIVHHFDGNPANNSTKNLVWVTEEEHKAAHRALKRVLAKAMHTEKYKKLFFKYFEEEMNE